MLAAPNGGTGCKGSKMKKTGAIENAFLAKNPNPQKYLF
jgi:hypothetical protein